MITTYENETGRETEVSSHYYYEDQGCTTRPVPFQFINSQVIRIYNYIFLYVRACLYVRHAYMCTGSSFKARNHVQIQNKCEILLLLLDQDFALFRMVHFVFLVS
jgi:hypothetical protein